MFSHDPSVLIKAVYISTTSWVSVCSFGVTHVEYKEEITVHNLLYLSTLLKCSLALC